MPGMQPTQHPRTSPPGLRGVRTHASTSLLRMYVYRSFLSREQMRLALWKIEQNMLRLHSLVGSKIRLALRELLCTDQLLTTNFSGGSTLNGTLGGDRWARVLGGQIGWLSDPLRRVHAGCSETGSTNEFENANSWKARKKNSPHPNHTCLLYTSPSPRDGLLSRMPSSA